MTRPTLSNTDQNLLSSFEQIIQKIRLPDSQELLQRYSADAAFKNQVRFYKNDTMLSDQEAGLDENKTAIKHFRRLQNFFPDIKIACDQISQITQKKISCNAFLSYPNTKGLFVHEDLDDSLIYQAEGEKHWMIWKPYSDDLNIARMARDKASGILEQWIETSKPFTFSLKTGQFLLLKAGHPHTVETGPLFSLHFTFLIFSNEYDKNSRG